ncbi:hypothetical protein DICVIV_09686 [Dictyocaulus viviparus]|uniref:Uncharacterized protein n=1 Tax=Dictyocaulus viviparus TaxID=29172 RepID=A0A0D8XKD4_DICVI|nr:hypothetical protein DICVIV_09686 [Dictyocaulus viviparus]
MEKSFTNPETSTSSSSNGPLQSFLQHAMSAIIAIFFALRIFIFSSSERDLEASGEEESPPLILNQMGPSSVVSLLSTDDLPISSSQEQDNQPPPPPPLPMLLQQSALPPFLDTINEEESDDLRSLSSASFASPKTIFNRSLSSERIDSFCSSSSVLSDSEYFSPVAKSPQHFKHVPSESKGNAAVTSTYVLKPFTVSREETNGLLKELARLGQDIQTRSINGAEVRTPNSGKRSIISRVAREMSHKLDIPMMDEQVDTDRDQEEELVYSEQQVKSSNMDDNLSLNSVSINLNSTKDNLLDLSITSNPTIDEKSAMENTILRDVVRPSVRPPSPPHDLPPPPPDLASPVQASTPSSSLRTTESQYHFSSNDNGKVFVQTQHLNHAADTPQLAQSKVVSPSTLFASVMNASGRTFASSYDRSGACSFFYYTVFLIEINIITRILATKLIQSKSRDISKLS